jgi:uncharacterized protein
MGNPVVHFEIGCRDSKAPAEFYASMFGWSMNPMGPAVMIDTGTKEGVQGHINSLGHEPHKYTQFYVRVDDIPATLKKIESLGGKTVVSETPIPASGSFAWFSDPEGNVVGLFKAPA